MDDILASDTTLSPGLSYTKDLEGLFPTTESFWDGVQQETISGPAPEEQNSPTSVPMEPGGSTPGTTTGPVTHGPAFSSDEIQVPLGALTERLRHAASFLCRVPRVLVETLGTPWCHADVFKDQVPKCFKGITNILLVLNKRTF